MAIVYRDCVQCANARMADYFFTKAESWEELLEEHDRWLERYNTHRHEAHEDRQDGRHSPSEVLGVVRVVRHHPTDLGRAFFSTRFTRKLDASGYARIKHWRVYAEEGLARCEVAIWIGNEGLAVEYGGQTLSRYDVSLISGGTSSGKSEARRSDQSSTVSTTRYGRSQVQPRLFSLEEVLGKNGWLKSLRLEDYALRKPRRPQMLQDVFVLISGCYLKAGQLLKGTASVPRASSAGN